MPGTVPSGSARSSSSIWTRPNFKTAMRCWCRLWSEARSDSTNIWTAPSSTVPGLLPAKYSRTTSFPCRNRIAKCWQSPNNWPSSGKYFMGTINNESKELNQYRIQTFGLREIFSVFISSCFVGLRKPEAGIYRLALEATQKSPQTCCFIDDRALNLEAAKQLGMHTIEMHDVEQLRRDLRKLEVEI